MRNDMYLKPIDVPLIRTNTMCGVKKWIAELKDKDLFWHMDDDARQVPAFSPPVSANLLEAQRLLALNICHNHRIDIWTLIPMITTLKAFCATRVYETGPTMEELALLPRVLLCERSLKWNNKEPISSLAKNPSR